jgi:cytidylate kinase
MPVITIRGQLGSGAPEIGKIVADRLHIDYVDKEIIDQVAERLKCSRQGIEDKEMPPGTLLSRITESLGRAYPLGIGNPVSACPVAYLPTREMPLEDVRYLAGLESVVEDLARSQAVVIQGRGSQFILKNFPGTIHVLIQAALELRLKRVMDSLKLDEAKARKEIEHYANSRNEFIKRFFRADLEDSANYDLVISTNHFSFFHAASVIIAASFDDKGPALNRI